MKKGWILPVVTIIALAVAFLLIILGNNALIRREIENPPTLNYIEEDLEDYLLSTTLYVHDYEQVDDVIIYTVEDVGTHNLYRVKYQVKAYPMMFFYSWRYAGHVYIGAVP